MTEIVKPHAMKPRTWVLIAAAAVLLMATAYVMATDHSAAPFGGAGPAPINPLYAVSGLVVGLLVGLTGVGGGALMTPILVLLFGFHPGTAVGTDLLYASVTKTAGATVHGANHTVDWRITRRLAYGSVPTTIATLLVLYALGLHGANTSRAISLTLGIALFATAASVLLRQRIVAFVTARFAEPGPRATAVLTTLLGALLGAVVTLSSVGAGAIGVTVMLLLYPRLPTARIVGSDIAHAVPLTLIAGFGHWLLGDVNLALLGSLLVGSIPGVVAGSYLTGRIPDSVLRPILAVVLVLSAAKLVF